MPPDIPHPDSDKTKFWRRVIWVSAACTVIPPVIGLLGTVRGMIGAMDAMGIEGGSDPETLAENISLALMTTAGGLVVSLIALPIFILALVKFFRCSREQPSTLTRTEQAGAGNP
jgi:biopolymer transport protein ExbB/TolQ